MSGVVPVVPRFRFNDANGNPLAFGSVTVYQAGTTTLANTYQDKALTTANTNPVNLDANGECLFWVDGNSDYKFLLTTGLNGTGSTVSGYPVDNIPGTASNREIQITSNDLASASANTVFTRARDSAGVGGVIRVKSGTYTLNSFAMNVADQLWDFDPNATIHSSNAATVPAAIISANGVKVRGGVWDNQALSTDAFAQVACIKVSVADDVEITDGVYKAARGPCIDAYGTNRLKISDNTFKDTWYAAVFVRPQGADIQDIEISGNRILNTTTFSGYDYGINVHNDDASLYQITNVTIYGNTVRFPVIAASDFPLLIEVYGGPTGGAGDVVNVSVTGNNVFGGGIGISLSQVQDGTVSGNSVKDASRYGIEAVDPFGISISGNTVYGSQRGISLSQAGGGTAVTGNSVRNTTVAGVYSSTVSERVTINGNSISVLSGIGINMLSTSYFSIVGNSLDGNGTGTKAVMLDKSDRGVVSSNTGSDWTQNGILVFADTVITLNRIIGANNVWINTPNSTNLPTQLSGGAAIGRFLSYIGNFSDVDTLNFNDYADVLTNRRNVSGAGTPEGSVTAGIGSTYLRRDGGASTVLYIKESGTGNTGWVAK